MKDRIWYKAYHHNVRPSIEYEQITLGQALARTAERFPDNIALVLMGTEITYRQLDDYVNRFAASLKNMGVQKGDKVALVLPNIPHMVIAAYALFRLGAVAVMNNPLYTESELEHNLNYTESRLAICMDLFVPRLLALKEKTGLEEIIVCHVRDFLKESEDKLVKDLFVLHLPIDPQEKVYEFTDLLDGEPLDPSQIHVTFEDLAALIFTGGTTGTSKAVMLTHKNSSVSVQQFKAWLFDAQDGRETVLAVLPFFHVAGYTDMMNQCIYRGFTAVLIPRPDAGVMLEMTKRYKPTIFGAVPTLYVGILNHPEFANTDFSFVKGCLSGAAPLAMENIREWESAVGAPIIELYGLSETSAICHFNPWGGKTKVGSVGVPVPDTDCRIVDIDTGTQDMPNGESGEILVKGPQVCAGYYKNPEETAETIRDGWLHTGDIGYMDEEGYLFIVDRKKDVIIAGGYNIYPREIDEVLYEHPQIEAACAVGIPHPYRGETVKAVIVLKKGAAISEDDIIGFCREKLAVYKIPKIIEFRDALPMSATGKVLRRKLREEAIAQQKAQGS